MSTLSCNDEPFHTLESEREKRMKEMKKRKREEEKSPKSNFIMDTSD